MVVIIDKSQCFGCTACVNACPVQCIVMCRDREEGFDYPVANPDICIGCGKCISVCPAIEPAPSYDVTETYEDFLDLAKVVLNEGGVVFGPVMENDMIVGHAEAGSVQEVYRMCTSPLVQSDLYSVFEDIRLYLESSRKVLFAGTPCQVAGLKKYLGPCREGLLIAGTACNGVTGPGLWEMYVKAMEKRNGSFDAGRLHNDKKDPYMVLFREGIALRPSCYRCTARGGNCSEIRLTEPVPMPERRDEFFAGLNVAGVDVYKHMKSYAAMRPFDKCLEFLRRIL